MGNKERQKENAKRWMGAKNKNTDGLTMTITAYRGYKDVDVNFPDGVTRSHVDLGAFKKGKIAHPSNNKAANDKLSRTGLKRLNNDDDEMTVVRYGSSLDIDVGFSDGSISKHKTFDSFLKGGIKRPTAYNDKICEGLTIKATNGQMFTVKKYHAHNDIECEFEDGTIVHAKSLQSVLMGSVVNPNKMRESKYTGLIIIAKNGLRCKVQRVEENTAYYIFEDGETGHMSMSSFLQRMMENPRANLDPTRHSAKPKNYLVRVVRG